MKQMKITKEMVEYVAALSRLKLSDQEKTEVQKDLGSIIDYIDMLNNVDTTDIEPMSHTFAIKNVFRKDEVLPSFDREELLKNAPKRDEESFIVPKTVE
jgi:aspartyl-tRNA(Asn)/glutamyl-tRNA(Gln) amidotransferase subunit C